MEDELDLDPERRREALQAAARAILEGMASRRPLVLALEDVHWADNGMLDLVEHVAQWARGPVLILALARDELLERRSGWGTSRRATTVSLHPLTAGETAELARELLGSAVNAEAVAERSGGNPFFAEELARRLAAEGAELADLPDTVHALIAARLDALPPFERRLLQQAAVVGRTFWAGALRPLADAEGEDLQAALDGLAERELVVPGEARELAGEPELAFKHVLIRDVAYGLLPHAVRARKHFEVGAFIESRAGDRADEFAPLLAEHYGRAAALGTDARLDEDELAPMRAAALRYVEAAGDAAARLFSNEEAFDHYAGALAFHGDDPVAYARIAEKQGDVALRLARVDAALKAWRACLEHHQAAGDLPRVGGTLRKIGAALAQQGERRAAIEHLQAGMNLLKEGPPSVELVRLYEDAAWLYVQSGDNMLAIYAAEKALRLARELGEAAVVSRAHGIFGRVFSRIGDATRARENLERAVELARAGGDPLEEVLALLALANHLEIAEADYAAAEANYSGALAVASRVGDVPSQVELHAALASLAVLRADWDAVRELSSSARALAAAAGLVLKLCLPRALEGLLHWREGEWDEAEASYRGAAELAAEVGWSDVQYAALYGLAVTLRDRDDPVGALVALDAALAVTGRAGLTVQSLQAMAGKAVVLALIGRDEDARAVAEETVEMTRRVHSPVGEVAALEADGATSGSAEILRQAVEGWEALGRPLDAARCQLLMATVTRDRDASEAAAAAFERLGVGHLADRARALAT
jgi:predicted ATPase